MSDDGSSLELAQAVGYRLDVLAKWKRFSLDTPMPLTDAVRTVKFNDLAKRAGISRIGCGGSDCRGRSGRAPATNHRHAGRIGIHASTQQLASEIMQY